MTRDSHPRLVRLLQARAGAVATLVSSEASGWASLTYAGQRHRVTLALPEGGDGDFTGRAADEFAIPGHLLVELAEVGRRRDGAGTLVDLAATTVERG